MLEVVRLTTLSGNSVWLNTAAVAQVMKIAAGPCGECGGSGKRFAQMVNPLTKQPFPVEAPCSHCRADGQVPEAWGVVLLSGIFHAVEKRMAMRVVRALKRIGQLPGDEWKGK